jgi:hypothetical protein
MDKKLDKRHLKVLVLVVEQVVVDEAVETEIESAQVGEQIVPSRPRPSSTCHVLEPIRRVPRLWGDAVRFSRRRGRNEGMRARERAAPAWRRVGDGYAERECTGRKRRWDRDMEGRMRGEGRGGGVEIGGVACDGGRTTRKVAGVRRRDVGGVDVRV